MKKKVIFFADAPGSILFMSYLMEALKKDFKIFFISSNSNNYMTNIKVSIKIDEKRNLLNLFNKVNPEIIFLGFCSESKTTKINEKFSLIAHNNNKKVIAVSDSIKNLNYRYWDNKKSISPDLLIVADKDTKEEFKKKGFKNQIFISGHPHYERLLSEPTHFFFHDRNLTKLSNSKKIVLIDEPEIPKVSMEHDESLGTTNQSRTYVLISKLISIIKELKSKIEIIILIHPRRKKIKKFKEPFVKVCRDNNQKYPLIFNADIVVGMSSSLLIESSLIGKPTISYLESNKNFREISSYASKSLLMIDNNKNLKSELMKFLSKKKPMNFKFRKRKNFFNQRIGALYPILKKLMD